MIRSAQNNIFYTSLVAIKYYLTYLDKNLARTSGQSGYGCLMEGFNTPRGSHNMFKIHASIFYRLHDLLVSTYGLKSSIHMNSTMEALSMFLITCGHGWSNGAIQYIFKHSEERI